MGQAKRRGTFEERKVQAIERDRNKPMSYQKPQRLSPRRASLLSLMSIFGVNQFTSEDFGLTSFFEPVKRKEKV